ncbi:MAG: hypothetical protein KJN95_06600 [Gammaproteobacteria bacterium]|nr:hypothetical protein [Gammaproteobacteria bacterium]MBT8436461.1 hypothetical protein [Gammaproteobacteria bacterium]
MKYTSLTFKLSLVDRLSYLFRRFLMLISSLPGVGKFGELLVKTGTRIENFRRLHYQQEDLFDAHGARTLTTNFDANRFESGYGYEDEFTELKAAAYYRAQIEAGNLESQKTESGALYKDVIGFIDSYVKENKINRVVNFGGSYAYIDTELAKLNPEVEFICLDRSRLTKIYNENIFSDLGNLNFVAEDVFDYVQPLKFQDSIFLHIRTLTLLPQSFVEKLYNSVSEAGFHSVICYEQCGISYETGKPFEFSDDANKQSVNFRSGMFIHNYPGLLNSLGFEINQTELLKTNHPDRTYRIAKIVATKILPTKN